ncbi:MAG TPA: hypothetical protein VGI88_15260, partial [Verrucomicrobiae bacterium]
MAATVLGTGCVTNGRQILMKEYGPGVPALADVNLKGSTICIKDFKCAPNLATLVVTTKAEEPNPFKYMDLTREQDKIWDKEMHDLQKQIAKADLREIGNMRNGFGMVMSHVYALNDPAIWLAEGLKFDLEAQGAKVVDASQAADADVSVSATIQLCHVDMYMTEDAQLVVDLEVQSKQGEPRHRQIHTHGATAAVLASEGEYFHAFRDAREKFSIFTAHEISESLKAKPSSTAQK